MKCLHLWRRTDQHCQKDNVIAIWLPAFSCITLITMKIYLTYQHNKGQQLKTCSFLDSGCSWCFLTVAASVSLYVCFKICYLVKSLATEFTGERFHSSMNYLVTSQMSILFKGFPASLALVRSLSRMNSPVKCKMRTTIEIFTTNFA